MQRQYVSSSRISSVGWENNVMEIGFPDGAVYHYYNVTRNEYMTFMNSPSKGSALSQLEKSHQYSCV